MKTNLKEFVERFVEKQAKSSFPSLYIVDKQTGPYRSIQQAIEAAEPHSLIKVSSGFYEENLFINKPLRLEPKSSGNEDNENIGVVLLVNSGAAMTVQLPESDMQCTITGIKVSHSGNSENQLQNELLEHEHILNIFESKENEIEQLEHEYVNRVQFSKIDNTILFVERGRVEVSNCILSLNYLVKSCNTVIPAVCIEKEGALSMQYCEIKGHPNKETIGIICKLGSLFLENTSLSHNNQGAVLIWGVGQNSSRIIKNTFLENSVGVHVVGENFKLKVYSNNIFKNSIGIKVGLASEPDISRNNISENGEGIEVYSAFPLIYMNIIEKQQLNGVVCKSYKKMLCQAEVKKNIAIVGNGSNGIIVEGENNKSKISQNHLIGFNREIGIKVSKEAFPLIVSNKIHKNHREGILVVEKSNAVIEGNEITNNAECNIALGGENSHHSAIIENSITHSPGPGIILVHSGRCKITRNDISCNSEGILMIGSKAEMRRNYISQNRNNGIVCEEASQPKIIENFVTRNQSIGAFLRDQSGGNVSKGKNESIVHSNIIVSNEIDIGLEEENQRLVEELKYSNTIDGAIEHPENVGCQIM